MRGSGRAKEFVLVERRASIPQMRKHDSTQVDEALTMVDVGEEVAEQGRVSFEDAKSVAKFGEEAEFGH